MLIKGVKHILDITQLLQDTIYFDNQVMEKRDLMMGPTAHLQQVVVRCDQSLADCYQPVVDYGMQEGQDHQLSHDELAQRFTIALHWFLLFSAKKQWTHLVVMSKDDYQRLTSADRSTKLVDLDKEYLSIKYLLLESYYTHQQDAFRHAWHLLLKYGLVDLQITEDEIMQIHRSLTDLQDN